MKEFQKTFLFAAAAVLVAGLAWLSGPSKAKQKAEPIRGQLMFKEFTDPLAVTRMEIMRFDDAGRKFLPFEVAQVNNKWCIPSHGDYPADAKEHLAEAATSLMGLKYVDYASKEGDLADLDQNAVRQQHNLYGVVDPDPDSVKTSDTGVGMRVAMKDKEGKALLSIIVGKQVGDQANLHYVRKTGQDPVYVVEVDTSKLSTKFEDWIEKNLLKMNTMDLKQVEIHDYTFNIVGDQPDAKDKGLLTLDYNGSGDPHWKLSEDVAFDPQGKAVNRKLADDEELDTKKLDDLKYALDDLKIVDVNRKPAGLSQDLKASGDFAKDLLGARSLIQRGFYLVPAKQERDKIYYQLLSNKGEVRLEMNDGVEYVLRFGEVAGEPSAVVKPKDKAKEKPEEKKDEATPGMNRYLFVMAEFNQEAITKPTPEPLPAEKKAEGGAKVEGGAKPEGEKPAVNSRRKPEGGVKPEPGAKPEGGAKGEGGVKGQDGTKAEPEKAKPDGAKREPAKKEEAKPDEAKTEPPKKEEAKPDEAKKEPAKKEVAKEEKKPDPKAERERIEKENKQKQDEYKDKVAKGKEHVKELNGRFAEWYYVISDDVYRKVHLGRDEIVKKKEKKDKDAKEQPPVHDHDHDHDHDDHAGAAKAAPASEPEKVKKEEAPKGK
jgi:hypothetical protein